MNMIRREEREERDIRCHRPILKDSEGQLAEDFRANAHEMRLEK